MYPRRRKYRQSFDLERMILRDLSNVHGSQTSDQMRCKRARPYTDSPPPDGPPRREQWM
jgi:hypothetical protein